MNQRALTGFSIATVAVLAAAAVYAILALSSAAFSSAATPPPPVPNARSLELQQRLSRLAAKTLGPGHAVVSADVELNLARTHTAPVSYGLSATPLAIVRPRATGPVARIRVGVLVSATVTAATLAKLRTTLAAAAGIEPSRGDELAITRIPLCFQGATGC
jgi:hypothetical protein